MPLPDRRGDPLQIRCPDCQRFGTSRRSRTLWWERPLRLVSRRKPYRCGFCDPGSGWDRGGSENDPARCHGTAHCRSQHWAPTNSSRSPSLASDWLSDLPVRRALDQLTDDDFKYLTSIRDFPVIVDHDNKRIPLRRRDKTTEWLSNMLRILAVKVKWRSKRALSRVPAWRDESGVPQRRLVAWTD